MDPLVQGVDLIQPALQCLGVFPLPTSRPASAGLARYGPQLPDGFSGQQRQLLVQQGIGVHGAQVGELFWGGPSLGQRAQQLVDQPADRDQAFLAGRGQIGTRRTATRPLPQDAVCILQNGVWAFQHRHAVAARVLGWVQHGEHALDQRAGIAVHVHAQQYTQPQFATVVVAADHGHHQVGQGQLLPHGADLAATQPARIARAIEVFVMLHHRTHHLLGIDVVALHQQPADDGVAVELAPLFPGEFDLGLREHRVEVQHAQVVQEAGGGGRRDVEFGAQGFVGHPGHEPGAAQGMLVEHGPGFARDGQLQRNRLGQRDAFDDVEQAVQFR